MKEISNNEAKNLKAKLLEAQGFKCKLCSKPLELKDSNLDHQHLFKGDSLGFEKNGLIRGVLCRDCNVLEGKVWNALYRYGKATRDDPVKSRIKFVQRLVEYWNSNFSHVEEILHPKEKRVEKLSKSQYNNLLRKFKSLESSYDRKGNLKKFPSYTGNYNKFFRDLESI